MGEKHTVPCGTPIYRIAVRKEAYLEPNFDFPEVKDRDGKLYIVADIGNDAVGPNTEFLIYKPQPAVLDGHSTYFIPPNVRDGHSKFFIPPLNG